MTRLVVALVLAWASGLAVFAVAWVVATVAGVWVAICLLSWLLGMSVFCWAIEQVEASEPDEW